MICLLCLAYQLKVKSGTLSILDIQGRSQPVQVHLTKDTFSVYKEELVPVFPDGQDDDIFNKVSKT